MYVYKNYRSNVEEINRHVNIFGNNNNNNHLFLCPLVSHDHYRDDDSGCLPQYVVGKVTRSPRSEADVTYKRLQNPSLAKDCPGR